MLHSTSCGVEPFGQEGRRHIFTGLLSNQGEKSINLYFIMVRLRKSKKVMVLQSPVYLHPKHATVPSTNSGSSMQYFQKGG